MVKSETRPLEPTENKVRRVDGSGPEAIFTGVRNQSGNHKLEEDQDLDNQQAGAGTRVTVPHRHMQGFKCKAELI